MKLFILAVALFTCFLHSAYTVPISKHAALRKTKSDTAVLRKPVSVVVSRNENEASTIDLTAGGLLDSTADGQGEVSDEYVNEVGNGEGNESNDGTEGSEGNETSEGGDGREGNETTEGAEASETTEGGEGSEGNETTEGGEGSEGNETTEGGDGRGGIEGGVITNPIEETGESEGSDETRGEPTIVGDVPDGAEAKLDDGE